MTMTLKDYPILRLAIPLATGIFFARKFHPYLSMEWMCGSIIVLMLFISVFLWLHNFRYRWCFGAFVFLLFFGLGAFRMIYQWDKINVNWFTDAVNQLEMLVNSKKTIGNFFRNISGKKIYNRQEMQMVASAAALAKMVKTIIDTNILDSNGHVTDESERVILEIQDKMENEDLAVRMPETPTPQAQSIQKNTYQQPIQNTYTQQHSVQSGCCFFRYKYTLSK